MILGSIDDREEGEYNGAGSAKSGGIFLLEQNYMRIRYCKKVLNFPFEFMTYPFPLQVKVGSSV